MAAATCHLEISDPYEGVQWEGRRRKKLKGRIILGRGLDLL